MKKTVIIIMLVVSFIAGEACNKRLPGVYNESLERWKNSGIYSYFIKIDYRNFSLRQGVWTILVENGKVIEADLNGIKKSSYIKFAERFTVDSLYRMAAYAGSDQNAPLVTIVEFNETIPYIKSLRFIANDSFSGNVKKDAGFSIVIMEFKSCNGHE